jgi:hypothetical protein
MSEIHVRCKLSAEHLGKDSILYPMIAGKTRRKSGLETDGDRPDILWDASWWGLNDSATFRSLNQDVQDQAVSACSRSLLNESYFIEKSGLAYTAKMVLLAPSTDVAQLYAVIGADEAAHLAWIEPFVSPQDKTRPQGGFLAFLSSLIEDCNPQLLIYLVQVILEGWGLDHYKKLARGCLYPPLAEIFSNIVKDEALHHHSGIVMHDAVLLSSEDKDFIAQSLRRYAEMVCVGPQSVISAVDQAAGGLSEQELVDLATALDAGGETARKLALLESLMRQPGLEDIVDVLRVQGYFMPLPAAQMVKAYLQSSRP